MLNQIVVNGIVSSAGILLIALTFSLIYSITRFFHFAHAVIFTFGAYFTYLFVNLLELPLFISISLAVIISSIMGCLMDILIYRPLRYKNASSMILLLASLGIYIVLQNLVSVFFGDDTKSIQLGPIRKGLNILGARITPVQIVIICISIWFVVTLTLFLRKSKLGKAMRAVANDPGLADISGINSNRVVLWTFAMGSGLAGFAGILVAMDVGMTPTMGMNALMLGVVAMIVGGVGSITGVAFGSLLLGLAQHLGVWKISSQWQEAIAFIILFVFLLFKPEGFKGKKIKKAKL